MKDATLDHVQVDTWFKAWPESNVGVETGQRSGVIVGDVDPRNGGFDSVPLVGFPVTRMAETGSGGFHYYLSHQGPAKQHQLAQGIDLKADGGYVVAPPSNHIAGSYRWLNENDPIAPAPASYLNGKVHLAPQPTTERQPNGSLLIFPDARGHIAEKLLSSHPKGARHPDLISLAGYFVNREPIAVTLAILTNWGETQCDPPLQPAWVRSHVEDAYRRWYKPPELPEEEDYWTSKSLLAADLPPPSWVVDGLLPEGLCFLGGRPKRGKSFLALQVAMDVVCGGNRLGVTTTGKVVYLALEDSPRRLQSRLRLMRHPGSDDLIFLNSFPQFDNGGLSELETLIQTHHPTLIVVDTLARCIGGKRDQDSTGEMTELLAPLQTMALKYRCCIWLLDHHRKPGQDTSDSIDDLMGSTAKTAIADAILGLYRKSGQASATLKVTGRDVEEKELALTWNGLKFEWQAGASGPDQLTTQRNEICAYLKEHGQVDIEGAKVILGAEKSLAYEILTGMVDAGILGFRYQESTGGRPRRLWYLSSRQGKNDR